MVWARVSGFGEKKKKELVCRVSGTNKLMPLSQSSSDMWRVTSQYAVCLEEEAALGDRELLRWVGHVGPHEAPAVVHTASKVEGAVL